MSEIEKTLEVSERRIASLENGYQAILELSDKIEKLSRFQDKIDIRSSISQNWSVFLDEIGALISIEICALFLVDEETHEFVLKSVSPPDKGSVCEKEIEFQIECGMFSWIINRREPAILPSLVFKEMKTIIMLPLSTVKSTLGVVFVLTPIEESSITHENMRLMSILAKQCSLVMENTLLYDDLMREHESLQEAQAQVLQAEKLASIGRLTAGASHEILNPLNIISGHIQLLQRDKEIAPLIARHLDIMRGQSDRIAKIVKDLLQFSRQAKSERREININHLIEKIISLVDYEAKFDRIDIIRNLDVNLPPVTGDGEKLSQVLFNLLSNARDAMEGGGTLTISTKISTDNDQLPEHHDLVEITFEDSGCGIGEEDIGKIFEPFFTTKETGNGTGLGLSLSYGIVREHGGAITVESRMNEGTVFTVCLPATIKEA